jgi:hypothetical protein
MRPMIPSSEHKDFHLKSQPRRRLSQMSTSCETAAESLTIHNNLLLMALRMTFSGSPCPSLWGYILETLADVCNAL